MVIACEIKVSARRGVTLLDVYGGASAFGKLRSLMRKKTIHAKFDKTIDHIKSLIPPPETAVPKPLSRNSSGHAMSKDLGPPQGLVIKDSKQHEKVHCMSYVPVEALDNVSSNCIWWSAGNCHTQP